MTFKDKVKAYFPIGKLYRYKFGENDIVELLEYLDGCNNATCRGNKELGKCDGSIKLRFTSPVGRCCAHDIDGEFWVEPLLESCSRW